jgi:hypothetical protein
VPAHLKRSAAANRNPHILTLSPPLNLDPKWFRPHVAYTIAKYGMSMCVLGMAEIPRRRHRGECLVAAHGHRHRCAGDDPGGRDSSTGPASVDHGRRRPRHPDPRCADDDRKFLHR